MQKSPAESALVWAARIGVLLVVFLTPFFVSSSMFFPYITGKNFFFRIIVELTFGVWVGLAVASARYRPRSGLILWAFAGFVAALSISTMVGANPYHSFWSNFERMEGLITILHLLALFLVASSVFRSEREWSIVFYTTLAASFIISIYGTLERFGAISPGGSVAGTAGAARIFATLGNPIYLAAYLLVHLFLLGFLFSRTNQIWLKMLYAALLLFEFFVFTAAGTRGAFVGLIAGVGVLLFLVVLLSKNRNIRLLGAGVIVVGALGLFGLFQLHGSDFVTSQPLLRRLTDINITSSTVQSRFLIWGIAAQAFKERPFFGWGPDNFIIPYAKYYNPNLYGNEPWFDRAHNMLLEWLVAGGAVGFIFYLSIFIAAGIVLWRMFRNNTFTSLGLGALLGLFIAYLVQNVFVFDNIVTYILTTLVLAFLHTIGSSTSVDLVPSKYKPLEPRRLTVVPIALVCSILVAVGLNARPMSVASGIIESLNSTGQGSVSDFLTRYDVVLKQGTFGRTEARERLVDLIIQSVPAQDQQTFDQYYPLLARGISELEEELEGTPDSLRHLITLGKLYQLRFATTRDEVARDKSLATYRHAIEVAPHYPSTYIGLAETYLAAGDYAKAAESVDGILKEINKPNPLFFTAIMVSAIAGNYDMAMRQIDDFAVVTKKVDNADLVLDRETMEDVARRSLMSKNPEGRERFLLKVRGHLREDLRENPIIYMALAETEVQLGKKSEAILYAQKAVAVAPEYKTQVDQFLKEVGIQ